jgi:hypothetical protein
LPWRSQVSALGTETSVRMTQECVTRTQGTVIMTQVLVRRTQDSARRTQVSVRRTQCSVRMTQISVKLVQILFRTQDSKDADFYGYRFWGTGFRRRMYGLRFTVHGLTVNGSCLRVDVFCGSPQSEEGTLEKT